MNLLHTLAEHGASLLLGVTALLGVAALVVRFSRRPVDVQRVAELGLLVALLYLPLALTPLPRWSPVPTDAPTGASTSPSTRDTGGGADTLSASAARAARALADATRTDGAWPALGSATPGAPGSTYTPAPGELPSDRAGPHRDGPHDARAATRGADGAPPDTLAAGTPSTLPTPLGAAAQAAPRVEPSRWPARLALLYLAGVALGLVRLALGWLRLRRLVKTTRPAPDEVVEWLREAPLEGLDSVRVRVTDGPHGPFCVGLRRPLIVLPATLLAPDARASLQPVLLHEAAHAARRDARGRWLAALALPLLWVHPLAWWLRARARRASELLADDVAAAHSSPTRYARALVDLAAARLIPPPAALHASTVLDAPHDLTRRIDMLLHRTHRLDASSTRRARWSRRGLAVVALTLSTALLGAPAHAQDAEADALRAERDALHAELASLRAALTEMQDLVAQLNGQAAVAPAPAATVEELPLLGFLFEDDGPPATRVPEPPGAPTVAAVPAPLSAPAVAAVPAVPAPRSAPAAASDPFTRPAPTAVVANPSTRPAPLALAAEPSTPRANARGGLLGGAPPPRAAAAGDELSVGGELLDLVTRHIDMRADLEVRERALAREKALADKGLVSQSDWHAAQVQLQALQLKLRITGQLIQAELHAAEVELAALTPQAAARRVRLQARIEVLLATL